MLEEILMCETLDAWSQVLFSLAKDCGFSSVLFGVKPTISTPFSSSTIISNYSKSWRAFYDSNACYEVDPVVFHCLNSSLPLVWTKENFINQPEQQLYEAASASGVRSGLCMPIHGPRGEFGMLNFITDEKSPADLINAQGLPQFALMRDYLIESFQKLQNASEKEFETPPKLTARELECLKWVAAGKTSWEISRILSCAEVTVNYHVTNFMRKFNAESRQHAVISGIRSGLVTP
ncbi:MULTISPECIES: helix-turn-helix transcriptional regulator [Pseudomonas fluorescens group]|uniref:LuxR family transcriptional regulator n=1 Tax=Pseudomonas fluorescens TaxID=294 RepID=A0AAE2Q2P3_PSEFL|nr:MULTISPECIES: LuxR family transcriptional regulator [Pseudomonas fluorescens group]MBA1429377.1 hypothetical protein [Pseudomonas orientalis]MBD8273042.1 LuxR family transcriptional regulator [Pseudomonas fluorescens]